MSVGQDTTGSAMSWMVKYLDDNQEVLKALQVNTSYKLVLHTCRLKQVIIFIKFHFLITKMKDEIHSLEKRVTDKSFLTLEDLNEMIYAAKVYILSYVHNSIWYNIATFVGSVILIIYSINIIR